ncbi:MAG: HPr family phosphocarrier protein [Proteobacteria bacterium]|nr:HPr family phosphocarrier protein [Cystobacterineae bacterium]MCL2259440.1 HPr family phosphocarrier protein [Cystobacterineae bacterium]MCL2314210.1 HPr family phosphocarrier protein [Pseudomonadota bacterium]
MQHKATFEIINQLGLHARAAAQLVRAANSYSCTVSLSCAGETVNAKSIMGVLMLAVAKGMQISLCCEGEGAEACLREVEKLIQNRFGEPR